ncbi:hypothetical protein [Bradyrhizobium sp. 37]|uniref:hypothetical protein n=1 Tax=Bradyrhizobium sp. 37 TaxID=2782671 RepID=UPI001FF8AFA9|nr:MULTISPECIES: hypothetical protein [unclassified Bradyrhizobium]
MEDTEDRREFLKSCGKFAAVTPPCHDAVAVHLSDFNRHTSSGSRIVHGNNGYGSGGGDGSPNNKEDRDR